MYVQQRVVFRKGSHAQLFPDVFLRIFMLLWLFLSLKENFPTPLANSLSTSVSVVSFSHT